MWVIKIKFYSVIGLLLTHGTCTLPPHHTHTLTYIHLYTHLATLLLLRIVNLNKLRLISSEELIKQTNRIDINNRLH